MNAELLCSQLYEELFGQSRRIIQPLRKIRSPSNFKYLKEFGLKNTIFAGRGRGEDLGSALFGPFGSKSAKIRPQICPAAPFFIRPFLTFVAEQSASWQHC
jgi:hypothetical protein